MLSTVDTDSNTAHVEHVGSLWRAWVGARGSGPCGWGETAADALADLAYLCHALHWTFDDTDTDEG